MAGAAGLAFGGSGLLRRFADGRIAYQPIPGLPGFRRVAGGAVSGGPTPFVGIDSDPAPRPAPTAPCAGLFDPGRPPDAVPIAYFTDARCVNCRQMSPLLARLAQQPGLHVTWHEWPILGQPSRRAARAALAARAQGAYATFHHALMGGLALPTDAYLATLAQQAGIDPKRLLADMTGPAVERQLTRTAALARRFGFIGTPGLVIGRTVVTGRMDERRLTALIHDARTDPSPSPCDTAR